jgi:hypothetical protein
MGADGNRNFDVSFGGKLTKYRVTISKKTANTYKLNAYKPVL